MLAFFCKFVFAFLWQQNKIFYEFVREKTKYIFYWSQYNLRRLLNALSATSYTREFD